MRPPSARGNSLPPPAQQKLLDRRSGLRDRAEHGGHDTDAIASSAGEPKGGASAQLLGTWSQRPTPLPIYFGRSAARTCSRAFSAGRPMSGNHQAPRRGSHITLVRCLVCHSFEANIVRHMQSKHPECAGATKTARPPVAGSSKHNPAAPTTRRTTSGRDWGAGLFRHDNTPARVRPDGVAWKDWVDDLEVALRTGDTCWWSLDTENEQELLLHDPTALKVVGVRAESPTQKSFRPARDVASELSSLADSWRQEREREALKLGPVPRRVDAHKRSNPGSARRLVERNDDPHLTDFNWHATNPEPRRHLALQQAVTQQGSEQVLKKLGGCRRAHWYPAYCAIVEKDIRFVQMLSRVSNGMIDYHILV